jgi:hypothetical protein
MRIELFLASLGFALMAIFELPQHQTAERGLAAQPAANVSKSSAPEKIAYAHGTLHDVALSAWVTASAEDQLATSADWALAFPSVRDAVKASGDLDSVLPYAHEMQSCVSRAAEDASASARARLTSDVAAICAVLLKWVSSDS